MASFDEFGGRTSGRRIRAPSRSSSVRLRPRRDTFVDIRPGAMRFERDTLVLRTNRLGYPVEPFWGNSIEEASKVSFGSPSRTVRVAAQPRQLVQSELSILSAVVAEEITSHI